MLRTAPPETIEQAHAEAFAKLTPDQRQKVLADVSAELPPSERATSDDPRSLARMATRAEMRNPGTMERTLGGGRGGGMGMGGMIAGTLLASVAGAFIGTAIADAFLDDEGAGDAGGEEMAAAEDPGAEDPGAGDLAVVSVATSAAVTSGATSSPSLVPGCGGDPGQRRSPRGVRAPAAHAPPPLPAGQLRGRVLRRAGEQHERGVEQQLGQ